MGNVLFLCRSPSMKTVRVNQAVRVNHRCRSSCWFLAPSKQKRRSARENSSSNCQGPSSGSFSQNMCTTGSEQQRLNSKSRPTSKISISSLSQNYRVSLVHPKSEGPYVHSPTSFYSSLTGYGSPHMTRKSLNQHCSQQQRVNSPSCRSSPMIYSSPDHMSSPASCSSLTDDSSPDMKRKSFNQHCSQQQRGYSPSSRPSPMGYSSPDITSPSSRSSLTGYSSPDMRRKSFNQHCDQQRSVNSPTSRSSPVSSPSRDLTRMYFNQHCYQQLHPASSLKQCRSPRRNSKPGSGKSSRRKRIGMRSPAHRTTNFKSPGRALNGCIEYNEDKKYEMRSQSPRSSNPKTLARILNGCNEENEDKLYVRVNAMPSPCNRTSYSTSSRRTADGRKGDSSPRYQSFYDDLVAVERVISSPISRKAALSLVQRHKLFANRKYSISSKERACRHWKPALDSISEVIDWEPF